MMGAPTTTRFAIGMDVGKTNDPTALAIIEEPTSDELATLAQKQRDAWMAKAREILGLKAPPPPHQLRLRQLQRLPLGTKYPDQVAYVMDVMSRPPLYKNCELIIDATGVGAAVCDMFEDAGCEPIAVTIHGGVSETVMGGGRKFRVSKTDLISCAEVILQNRHIGAPKAPTGRGALAEWDELVKEMQNFRHRPTKKPGQDAFEAREGQHDDLVLAFSLAVWRKRPPGGRVLISGIGDLGAGFNARLEAERAEWQAAGLQHPFDLKAQDILRAQEEEAAQKLKFRALVEPEPIDVSVRQALIDKHREPKGS
jgi:hypothetical protein